MISQHLLKFTGTSSLIKIGALCLLTACSPYLAPLSEKVAVIPRISENSFTSFDGTELPLKVWLPIDKLAGVIIGVHGFNDYANFIKGNAPFFNQHGLAVYAYDQRGFGASKTRGRWSGGKALAEDLATLVALVREKHPATPIFILGDSMGGAVTIVAMARKYGPPVDGVILVAPALWARSKMPFYQRWLLWLAAHTVPWQKLSGGFLKITPSDNVAMLKELGSDPLIIKQTRVDVLYGVSGLMDEAYDSAELLEVRLLLLYGEKDEIIPEKPVVEFYQRLPLAGEGQQRMIVYEDGYHMLLRDLQAERVMQDIVDWIHDPAKKAHPH